MAIETENIAQYLANVMSEGMRENPILDGYERSVFEKMLRAAETDLDSGTGQPDGGGSGLISLLPLVAVFPSQGRSIQAIPRLYTQKGSEALTRVRTHRGAVGQTKTGGREDLGALSSRFESGSAGVSAIGYDSRGGTSYGIYQIASRPGTLNAFLDFLDTRAPQWAKRLRASGPGDTGGREGAMPEVWQQIAAEDPKEFSRLQDEFIRSTHYLPACQEIRDRTGVDVSTRSLALQQVIWSTAVHHGVNGAAGVVERAWSSLGPGAALEGDTDLIDRIYDERAGMIREFSPSMQNGLNQRFQSEKQLALDLLTQERTDIA